MLLRHTGLMLNIKAFMHSETADIGQEVHLKGGEAASITKQEGEILI